jgi:hypothetical protein
MMIRDAVDGDMAQIAPFFRAIVAAGETYAYRCKNPLLSYTLSRTGAGR